MNEPLSASQTDALPGETPGPRIYRAMRVAEGRPEIGTSKRYLGVSVEGDHLPLDGDGNLSPGGGGMSVAPEWRRLPRHRIPMRLQPLMPAGKVCKGPDSDWIWVMGRDGFTDGPVAPGLRLRVDHPMVHGLVEPDQTMSLVNFQQNLAATQQSWERDET